MSAIRRRAAASACAVVVLVTAACGPGQAADAGPPAETSPPSSDIECPMEPTDPVGAEQAATCVYRAWIADDETLESAYGAQGVTDELPFVAAEPEMTFNGCTEGGGTVLTGLVCSWTGVDIEPDVTLEMALSGSAVEGFRVAEVEAVRS
ncbi:hypothetical protein [Cellulomonas chengniuliangii]|uniref:hypothetical protein n=1 Tax=Cellulomonas chengniuliangii TaxID=2968084 RepID=UPI001D0DD3A0|nr:hypothetical protein [Cellulomonas chengniuliangii]MCC2316359.1 hypothetical protein [Cellulomonas chengniuliangii]